MTTSCVYMKCAVNSAYRSSLFEKAYEDARGTYEAKKENTGMAKWHRRTWVNQRGESGYKYKSVFIDQP